MSTIFMNDVIFAPYDPARVINATPLNRSMLDVLPRIPVFEDGTSASKLAYLMVEGKCLLCMYLSSHDCGDGELVNTFLDTHYGECNVVSTMGNSSHGVKTGRIANIKLVKKLDEHMDHLISIR